MNWVKKPFITERFCFKLDAVCSHWCFSALFWGFFFHLLIFLALGEDWKREKLLDCFFSSQCLLKAFACKALGITAREGVDREYKQPMKIQKKRDKQERNYERMIFIRGRTERRNDWTKKGPHRKVNWCLCDVHSIGICCSFAWCAFVKCVCGSKGPLIFLWS